MSRKRKTLSSDNCSGIKRQKLDSISRISFDDTIEVGPKQQEEEESGCETARFVPQYLPVVNIRMLVDPKYPELPQTQEISSPAVGRAATPRENSLPAVKLTTAATPLGSM